VDARATSISGRVLMFEMLARGCSTTEVDHDRSGPFFSARLDALSFRRFARSSDRRASCSARRSEAARSPPSARRFASLASKALRSVRSLGAMPSLTLNSSSKSRSRLGGGSRTATGLGGSTGRPWMNARSSDAATNASRPCLYAIPAERPAKGNIGALLVVGASIAISKGRLRQPGPRVPADP
jgi:hypothetical protein